MSAMPRSDETITYAPEEDDWVDRLVEPLRSECLQVIRDLSLNRLQKYPLRKLNGLPIGREISVLRRYLTGEAAVFERSALANVYSRIGGARDRLLHSAFVVGEALPQDAWANIIGVESFNRWRGSHLLRESGGRYFLRFRVFGIGPISLIADSAESRLLRRVFVGQDSLNLLDFINAQRLSRVERYLDVGPGSGVVLLSLAHLTDSAIGLDINPRAVKLSRINAELNRMPHVEVLESNVFEHNGRHGAFDRITWNMPYMLMPPSAREVHFDGYGGEFGVEIQLDFVRLLPTLLTPTGRALLGATSAIMDSGEDVLHAELQKIAPEYGLDIVIHVLRAFWSQMFPEYQRQCGVRNFEALRLHIRRGPGRVRRVEAPATTKATDALRGWLYRKST